MSLIDPVDLESPLLNIIAPAFDLGIGHTEILGLENVLRISGNLYSKSRRSPS